MKDKTTKTLYLLGIGSLLAGCNPNKIVEKEIGGKPNIIYILADDLGYGDLGCYNNESKIPTPNLDHLASQGMRFTDAHSPSAVCSPTRYGIITGQYCWRTHLKKGVLMPYDKPLIKPGQVTVASFLSDQGYHTAALGKWHLGWEWHVKDGYPSDWGLSENKSGEGIDLTKPAKQGPTTAGFVYYYGFGVPHFPPYCYVENNKIVGPTPDKQWPDSVYGSPGLMQEGWDYYTMLSTLTNKAIEVINEQASKEKPLFMYLAYPAVHVPLTPSEPFIGKSQAGLYGDMVVELDYNIGRIIDHLKKNNLFDNTLIIFTSDNGSHGRTKNPERSARYFEGAGDIVHEYGHRCNGKLKAFKGDAWEGGHRVPFIACWPKMIKPNQVNDNLISHTDLLPTCAAILNQELPGTVAPDGVNLLPTFLDAEKEVRTVMVQHSQEGKFAIRKGEWKLITVKDGGSGFSEAYMNKYDSTHWISLYDGQLYNFKNDPGEHVNLYAERTDIVEELTILLKKEKERKARNNRIY